MIRTISAIGVALSASLLIAAGAARRDDADQLIAARQAAFRLSGATFGAMKGAIDRGDDTTTLGFGARALTDWAHALPGMFPPGSDGGTTKALPTVWSDRAGFEAAARNYETQARKLGELAKAGDRAGVAAQWTVVRGACKACHDAYHQPEAPRG